jgi:hypothetical protein
MKPQQRLLKNHKIIKRKKHIILVMMRMMKSIELRFKKGSKKKLENNRNDVITANALKLAKRLIMMILLMMKK